MTARKTPAKATAPVKLSGEMVEAPSEALANETAAAASITQDVQAPADEVTDAIAELDEKAAPAKKATKKTPAKKPTAKPAPKEAVRTSHTDCTHAKTGRDGKAARAACRRERAAAEAKAAK